jgi:signal transduction histidine kinase
LVVNVWEQLTVARAGRQAKLCQETAGLKLRVDVDGVALGQVFRNILENSLAACADPVCISTRWSVVDWKGGKGVQVSLRDNGPGLSPEARQKLFQPFFTTKTRGTGLGLAIARRIVEAHGGAITVGAAELGTEIIITLPGDVV